MPFDKSVLAQMIIKIEEEYEVEITRIEHLGDNVFRMTVTEGGDHPLSGGGYVADFYYQDGTLNRSEYISLWMS